MRGEQVTLLRLDVHATGFGDSHFTLSGCCVVWMDGQGLELVCMFNFWRK